MRCFKKSLSVMLALITAMACSVSSFALVVGEGTARQSIFIEEKSETGILVVKTNDVIDVMNATKSTITVYADGSIMDTIVSGGGFGFSSKDTWVMEYSYKKGSHKLYLKDITDSYVAAAQNASASQQAAKASEVQNAPASQGNQAPGTPDLSNPQIKALWDQAVAVKAAYDAETNAKKKKELQKQFTDIMNQIPMK